MTKPSYKVKDPFAKREAEKYEHPIPSRECILQQLEDYGRPASFQALSDALGVETPESIEALNYRLRAMIRDGQLLKDRRNRYCLINRIELLPGRVIGHPDGFGFVQLDSGGQDLFLSARQMRKVFPGDRVLVRKHISDRRSRPEAIIHEVLQHNTENLVGRIFFENGLAFVEPEHKQVTQIISIPNDKRGKATHGQIVMVELLAQPSEHKQAVGQVIEVLGDHMAPGMEIDIAIRAYDLPHEWPKEVLEEIAYFKPEVGANDLKQRTDLRHLPFVTIDGEDAKDFDDAVYCEPTSKGSWRLLVAIADVSHYVLPNTSLDKEAHKRGNSVYFPERVIPMLPEILSNELCSLKPKVDRLCLVCDMQVSGDGKLSRSRFYTAVIHSNARLTYTEVAAILVDRDEAKSAQYEKLVPHLRNLYSVYQVLHKQRKIRGAIELDTTETRIVFGKGKKIEKIVPVFRNDAHRLIEECMLLANVSAARLLKRNKISALYRIHDSPIDEKLVALREFVGELGVHLKGGKKPQPKDYCDLLDQLRDRPESHLVQTILLRSFSQARYSPENIGHFGLAYPEYAHFTSPIRRYPDLLVHRAIRHVLEHKTVETFAYSLIEMESLGIQCSSTERRADEATRDVVSWLKCEFMQDHVGEVFPGIISSVTHFGLFVELKDIYVEGLVHVTNLPNDYYNHDAVKHRLIGERTGKIYRLADPVTVLVTRVDLSERKIDFELVV
jgi:ribonuclease R